MLRSSPRARCNQLVVVSEGKMGFRSLEAGEEGTKLSTSSSVESTGDNHVCKRNVQYVAHKRAKGKL